MRFEIAPTATMVPVAGPEVAGHDRAFALAITEDAPSCLQYCSEAKNVGPQIFNNFADVITSLAAKIA